MGVARGRELDKGGTRVDGILSTRVLRARGYSPYPGAMNATTFSRTRLR